MTAFQIGLATLALLVLLIIFIKTRLNLRANKNVAAPAKSSLAETNPNPPPTATANVAEAVIATTENISNSSEPSTAAVATAATPTTTTVAEQPAATSAAPSSSVEAEINIPLTTLSKECPLNRVIDCIVLIELPAPIKGVEAIKKLPEALIKGDKPIFFSGQLPDSNRWEVLHPQHIYSQLRAGIQLADLNGIISQLELSAFTTGVQEFASQLNAQIKLPNIEDEIFRAKIFSHAVIPSKQQLSLNLYIYTENGSWTPAFVQEQARLLGFRESANPALLLFPNKFANINNYIFTLSYSLHDSDQPQNNLQQLQLTLDFYNVAEKEQPFLVLQQVAQQLAENLNGKIVDSRLTPLEEAHFQQIQQELARRYQLLNSKNIPAGSALAKRLFS